MFQRMAKIHIHFLKNEISVGRGSLKTGRGISYRTTHDLCKLSMDIMQ